MVVSHAAAAAAVAVALLGNVVSARQLSKGYTLTDDSGTANFMANVQRRKKTLSPSSFFLQFLSESESREPVDAGVDALENLSAETSGKAPCSCDCCVSQTKSDNPDELECLPSDTDQCPSRCLKPANDVI
jgi:hypothetical protein